MRKEAKGGGCHWFHGDRLRHGDGAPPPPPWPPFQLEVSGVGSGPQGSAGIGESEGEQWKGGREREGVRVGARVRAGSGEGGGELGGHSGRVLHHQQCHCWIATPEVGPC